MAAIFNLQFSPLHLQLTYNILLIFLNVVNYKPSFPLCQSFFANYQSHTTLQPSSILPDSYAYYA